MSKRFNRNNCESKLRAVIEDRFGNKISLFGTHAFEWSIVKEENGRVIVTTYPKGSIARAEFAKLK